VGRQGSYRLCAVEGSAIETKMIFEPKIPGKL
jgi:hypothetical protein